MSGRCILIALGLAACAPVSTSRAPAEAAARTVDIIVAATTDVHGWVRGWDYTGDREDSARGLTRAATIVDSLRATAPERVILIDAGDLLQGNPFAYVAARVAPDAPNPIIAAMNAMRYDAIAIGNHEFNYGLPYLRGAIAQADFPFLAANAYAPGGTRAFPAWRLVERGGIRVGIVGATTPGSMVWDRENLRGQVVVRDIVPEVRTAVAEARAAGAQVIVVSIHSGLTGASSYDTVATGLPSENVSARVAREVGGIDLLVYGHSHSQMADTTIGTTLLMQPKNWVASVGVARLTVAQSGNDVRVTAKQSRLIPVNGRAEHPAVVAATEAAHLRTRGYVTTPIGSTPVAWRGDSSRVTDTPIIDFILEVERRVTGADLASTAAFSLDASLDAGPISIAELARLYPYDNTLRAIRISGRQLRQYLEQSATYYRTLPAGGEPSGGAIIDPSIPGYNFDVVAGADYTIDLGRPPGSRITTLTVRGRPVTDADSFTMALNNYRQTGGGNYSMLAGAPVVYDHQEEIRQLLIDEVQRRGTIRPEDYFVRNWRLEPAAAVARAYAEMHRTARPPATIPPGSAATPPVGGPTPATDNSDAARTQRRLRIISTNDFHGALDPRADAAGTRTGGASALASAIRRAQEECAPGCETLVVDGGDMFQGTPISNLSYGRGVVELFNLVGYSAAALGNHEFDWGIDTLRARMRDARFRIMGANVRYADGRDVEWIPDDTLITRGDLRIGIIGIATQLTPTTTRAGNVAGLRFDPPAPVVDSRARMLRARGANVVIVIGHVGGTCATNISVGCSGEIFAFARDLTEPIDAIFSGHSHSALDTEVRGMSIVQARSSARAIAVTDLPIGPQPTWTGPRAEVRPVFSDSLPGIRVVDSMVTRWRAAIGSRVNAPIARFATGMARGGSQHALGNYIADAQRWATKADVAVQNSGGIRTDLLPGQATYGTLYEIQPFSNFLMTASLPGSALRAYLERIVSRPLNAHVSGVTVRYDPARPAGSRITSITMSDGRPLRDDATYTISLNDFMAGGGDELGLPPGATAPVPANIVDLDALIDYSRSRPQPVQPPTDARFIVERP
jgi:2',3'-cyclic-nucleotide 2'-phosphodiesterase (5'-nucleotidase family)